MLLLLHAVCSCTGAAARSAAARHFCCGHTAVALLSKACQAEATFVGLSRHLPQLPTLVV